MSPASGAGVGHERIGLGFDVGGTKVLCVATTAEGPEITAAKGASPPDPSGLADALVALLGEVLGTLDDPGRAKFALGVSLPGLVDSSGILHAAPNLGAPEASIDLRRTLAEPLVAMLPNGLDPGRVAFDNDATAAAFAETVRGAGKGGRDVLVVSVGTGIGAGIVSAGHVLRGEHGYAGELGHMVIDPDGPECPCGRRGCFERFASGSGLAWLARRAGVSGSASVGEVRGEEVVELARGGDERARAVLLELAEYLALGLSNAVELLDPGRIVLAGGLMGASDVLLQPTRDAFVRLCRPAQRRRGEDLVIAELGEEAAAVGAALLGLELAGN